MEYVTVDLPPSLRSTIAERGFKIFDSPLRGHRDLRIVEQRIDIAQKLGNFCAVLIDNYEIDAPWESQVRSNQVPIVVIDDLLNRHHDCDLLIDTGIDTKACEYGNFVPPGCLILCGPEYALLREEFNSFRESSLINKRNFSGFKKIAISFGGSDPNDLTSHVLSIVLEANISNIQIVILVGQSNPNFKNLKEKTKNADCIFFQNPKNFAEILSSVDVAIGAGGISALERCALGLPSLVTPIAQNQERSVRALVNNSAAVYFEPNEPNSLISGLHNLKNPEIYKIMSHCASELVDGFGCRKVADAINQLIRMRY